MTRAYNVSLFNLLLLALALAIPRGFAQPGAPSEKPKAMRAEKDAVEKEARRALRKAQRQAALRAATLAPELAAEELEESLHELAHAPWPEIHEHMQLAREAMHEAQAELHGLDFTELQESLAELDIAAPPFGLSAPIAFPPIPPVPALAPMAPLPPHFDNCSPGWTRRGSFHSSKEYQAYLSDDERVRLAALNALIQQDENAALAEIKGLLAKSQNWALRAAAVELLACIDREESVALLRDTLRNETDQRIRLAAVRALSHHDDPEARAALQELLQK